jgi:hypothetical protein
MNVWTVTYMNGSNYEVVDVVAATLYDVENAMTSRGVYGWQVISAVRQPRRMP